MKAKFGCKAGKIVKFSMKAQAFSEFSDEVVLDLYESIDDDAEFMDKLQEHFPDLFISYSDVIDDFVYSIADLTRKESISKRQLNAALINMFEITKFREPSNTGSSVFNQKYKEYSPERKLKEVLSVLEDSESDYFDETNAVIRKIGRDGEVIKEWSHQENPNIFEFQSEFKESLKDIIGDLQESAIEKLKEDTNYENDFEGFVTYDETEDQEVVQEVKSMLKVAIDNATKKLKSGTLSNKDLGDQILPVPENFGNGSIIYNDEVFLDFGVKSDLIDFILGKKERA